MNTFISRRDFLKSSLTGAGLAIAVVLLGIQYMRGRAPAIT